jgi:HTH-type transcriptional regulator/antitoxin HigA
LVNKIITGKQELSPEIAVALESALGVPAAVWMQREAAYRLSLTGAETTDINRRAKLFALGPLKEMQKRGWLPECDTPEQLEREALRFFGIPNLDAEPVLYGALRKSSPTTAMTPAQRAWGFRVKQVASAIPASAVAPYNESKLEACRASVRKLAAYSAGVEKVAKVLMSYGIRFIVVEGLAGAKVDGYATWLDPNSPVIAMSLRYNRLDNFWFTLGHEMSHIAHRDDAPIDADVADSDEIPLTVKPPMERRADAESAAMLIPPNELLSFIQRVGPLYSTEKINQFANRLKMHPSVIIGQLKHRGEIKPSAHNKGTVPIRDIVVMTTITDGWGKSITKEWQ